MILAKIKSLMLVRTPSELLDQSNKSRFLKAKN